MAKIASLQDTIAAVATPAGQGGIGIVRVSGPRAVDMTDKIFVSRSGKPLSSLKSFCLRYGWIVRDKKAFEAIGCKPEAGTDFLIDEVLVTLMRAPKSYTKEDHVEISAHAGTQVLSSILGLLLKQGARLAEPGEFTKRAFVNGRMDLTQAEAVLDVIQADTELALRNSLGQLAGRLSAILKELRLSLVEICADMEARLDFSEEEIPAGAAERNMKNLRRVFGRVNDLLETAGRGHLVRDGLKTVIYGRPNTGKSSLLNALLKTERAIVTPVAGTTRDTIEECLDVQGLAVCLTDTAGVLHADNEIERLAIARTAQAVQTADLVLFVMDGSSMLTEEDRLLFSGIPAQKKRMGVINKSDLPPRLDRKEAGQLLGFHPIVEVSALTLKNIRLLEEQIFKTALDGKTGLTESVLVSNARHKDILQKVKASLGHAIETLEKGLSDEWAAGDVRAALQGLGELTGEVFHEEILDSIFSRFCIGK